MPASLERMAAPRPLVVVMLLAVTVAAISVTILAWIAIGTAHRADRVVTDAQRSVRRLDKAEVTGSSPVSPIAKALLSWVFVVPGLNCARTRGCRP